MTEVDALKDLHTALIDTRRGYEEATKDAETSDLKALFRDMVTLRSRDHEEIHRALTSLGEKPDESGSFLTTVHRAVIGLRAAVTGLDASALDGFVDGEERVIGKYNAALDACTNQPALTEILMRQKRVLLTKIAQMKRQEHA